MKQLKHINLLHSEIGNVYHNISAQLGLSDSVFNILYAIYNFGDSCLLSDIVSMSGMPKQTINSALRKLESDGIVQLETVKNKRKKVVLTESGKLLAQKTVGRIIQIEGDILSSWEEAELALYLNLFQRYLDQLREKTKELCK